MFRCTPKVFLYRSQPITVAVKTITIAAKKKLAECYKILNLPRDADQNEIKEAFLQLAKKYHPDSGSPEADVEKFVAIENAFRTLSKHTSKVDTAEVNKIVYDIKHTAPQHRQYLSYEGVGHGTPSQRMKQWTQVKAQRAADNVLEHRMSKALATDKSLMKKDNYSKKHDIKTKYGFDRLVEDLIQESMSKGEFENLSGKGKPLKSQSSNPYVDFTTHKLNEVLINNGFTPEWITMNKDIEEDIKALKEELQTERSFLGPYPLSDEDQAKWDKISSSYRDLSKSINAKINTFNLIVPLLNKQRLHVDFDSIITDVLENGKHSVKRNVGKVEPNNVTESVQDWDLFALICKAFIEIFKKKDYR